MSTDVNMSTPQSPAINKCDDDVASINMMLTAYKLYKIQSLSCTKEQDFILSTFQSAIWEDPLVATFKAAEQSSIDGITTYSIKRLCSNLANNIESNLRTKLGRKEKLGNKELIRKVQIIYYNIVFIEDFRRKVFTLFESDNLDKDVISLANNKGARVTQGTFIWAGNSCIECNKRLKISFRASRQDTRGSIGFSYHKHHAPKVCVQYRKKCEDCDISYYYNRIDYGKNTKHKAKKNQTLILDPASFDYFSIGTSSINFIHKSIWDSLQRHQYCHRSTSIEIWLQHYNDEWKAEYDALYKIIGSDSKPIELGYKTILKYFYWYALLFRVRNLEDENYKSRAINVNGRIIKIALIISDEDKKDFEKETNAFIKAKGEEPPSKSSIRVRELFNFMVNKYYEQLLRTEVSELKQVPVKLNDKGHIEIYPGWFVVYGDGGEKLMRLRCAYPAILSKYDYMMEKAEIAKGNDDVKDEEDDDLEDAMMINDIAKDDGDIDLAVNHNSRLYSSQRYYECDASPARNDHDNNRKSYKCCKYHTAKLVNTHKMKLEDISDFTVWYRLHSALATINNTNITETIRAQYSIDEEVVTSITKKQTKRKKDLEARIAAFKHKHSEKYARFSTFIEKINNDINSLRQKTRATRQASQSAKSKLFIGVNQLNQQEIYEKIYNILGDDDIELDGDYYNMTTPLQDLLALEFNSNSYLDDHKGCRKSKNISSATIAKTKGMNVLMNCGGMTVNLREEIVRETPTAVILDIADTFTNNQTSIEYANRIEAIGYDMVCRIYHHLKTLMENERLTAEHMAFWCNLIWVAFIDIWHVFKHTDDLCKEKAGAFHPTLDKFKDILYKVKEKMERVNDIIAEQFWSTFNSTGQLKSMNKETMLIFLLEKRTYYNQARIKEIKENGWTFIPIEWCTTLRDIKHEAELGELSFPSESQLKGARNEQLNKVQIKADKIEKVKEIIHGAADRSDEKQSNSKRQRGQLNDDQRDGDPNKRKKRKM